MNLKEFLEKCQERLSKMYTVKFTNTGKNKVYFSVNEDEFLVTKDKSWSPGLVKTIVEDGHMFPCVLEIRDDPPEYTFSDVDKLVEHIDEYFVTEAGLSKAWALCNRAYYLDSVFKMLLPEEDTISILSYLALASNESDEIEMNILAFEENGIKHSLYFKLGTSSFSMTSYENNHKITIEMDYLYKDMNEIIYNLTKKCSVFKLA